MGMLHYMCHNSVVVVRCRLDIFMQEIDSDIIQVSMRTLLIVWQTLNLVCTDLLGLVVALQLCNLLKSSAIFT